MAGQVVATAVATLFLFAASFKVLDASALAETLAALGMGRGWATRLSRAAPGAEVLVALLVVSPVPAALGAVAVAAAAACIGAAGVVALRRGESIPCACFSEYSTHPLGARQLVVAGGLLAIVPLLAWRGGLDAEQSMLLLVGACVAAVLLHCLQAYGVLVEAMGYRRAAAPEHPA